jgi:hypothetical protein
MLKIKVKRNRNKNIKLMKPIVKKRGVCYRAKPNKTQKNKTKPKK